MPEQGQKPEGMSMERRLLLAFALMGLVLFLTQYIYKPPASPPPKAVPPAQQKSQPKPAEPAQLAAPAAQGQVSANQEETFVLETNLYRIVFTNRGAVVRNWVLKRYKDGLGKPLELIHAGGSAKTGFPFSYDFPNGAPPADLKNALFSAKPSADGLGVEYQFSNGRVVAHKSFVLQKNRYLGEIDSSVIADGRP